jgi:cobalt-zinc-cadmium efflux system protein
MSTSPAAQPAERASHATLQVDHAGAGQDADLLLAAGGEAHCEDPHGPVHRPGPHPH